MIENLLTDALIKKIEEVVEDYRLPVENGEERCPTVFDGYLPPKRQGITDDFPFVVVRADGGKNGQDQAEITVSIIIGCYTKEFTGHKYCINIMTRIKNALCELQNGVLDNRFVLQFPIEWELVTEQPYPQWQLDMKTRWACRVPQAGF